EGFKIIGQPQAHAPASASDQHAAHAAGMGAATRASPELVLRGDGVANEQPRQLLAKLRIDAKLARFGGGTRDDVFFDFVVLDRQAAIELQLTDLPGQLETACDQ